MHAPSDDGQYVTFRQFSEQNPAWTEASLRWLRFRAAENGLMQAGAFVQLGRRVLVDKPRFFAWLRSRAAAQAVPARRSRAPRTAGSAEAASGLALAAKSGDE